MQEDFLHYLWKYKLYKSELHKTTNGETLEIIHPGILNNDAGPDFFNAKVKLGGTLWAGNIEIHTKASDWFNHSHHTNRAYDNVILHVVTSADSKTTNSQNAEIPIWVMPLEDNVIDKYKQLHQNQHWISCAPFMTKLSQFETESWFERMLIERFEQKMQSVTNILETHKNDWDETFYILLVRNFGFGINNEPFEQLARNTPWRTILKNADDLLRLEALFLGQAGFLTSTFFSEDKYIQTLKREYSLLSHKYGLKPVGNHNWKFLRLRPSNFPTIRLIQLAHLFHKNRISLSKIIETSTTEELLELFDISPKGYWLNHYKPDTKSVNRSKTIGRNSRELIIINTLCHIVFAYGKLRGDESLCQKSYKWLESLKPEQNSIIENWDKLNIKATNAARSQALVYLKQNYCLHKRCLHCRIGHLVISKNEKI